MNFYQTLYDKLERRFYYLLTRGHKKPDWFSNGDLSSLQSRLKSDGYYSQFGHDKWVVESLLPHVKKGVFVDVGAHDGVSFSNTLRLEQLGWKGMAIEPIPHIYEKLIKNRTCTTIQGCIGPKEGLAKFRLIKGYSEMLSGLIDEYDERHLKRIQKEVDLYGGEVEDIEVKCYNFNSLMNSHGITKIDYLSVDTEGAEFKILKSINFKKIKISVIGVENSYHTPKIPLLLHRNGLVLHSKIGDDEFYINKQLF